MAKKWSIFIILFLLATVARSGPGWGKDDEEGKVVARVNGVEITLDAVKRVEALISKERMDVSSPTSDDEKSSRQRLALENVIDEELLFQEATAQGIEIEKERVYQVIRDVRERMPGAEFSKLAVAHWAVKGDILKTIERDLMIKELLRKEVLQKVKVSEKELKEFYEANKTLFYTGPEAKLQQILFFAVPGWQLDKMLAQAVDIAARSRAGEDFVALARAYSEGPARDKGGDLGWRSVEHLPLEMQGPVREVPIGTTLDPILMPWGIIIVKVTDKRQGRVFELAEVRDHVAKELSQSKLKARYRDYIEELRKKSKVEVLLSGD